MKRLLTILLLLVVVRAPAAIVYYDDYPHQPTPPDTYILSIQTGDKSVGGTPYNFWTLGDMTSWLQTVGFTNGASDINIITNNSFIYATNIDARVITNVTFVGGTVIITNVTIVVPGGVTNLNLTPNSLMQSDANDAESSVPNGTGVLTNDGAGGFGWTTIVNLVGNFIDNNNGNGTNTTLWGTTIFDELDVDNAYLTNLFILVTNAPLLSTDGDGKVIAGDFLVATNNDTVVSNGLYAQIVASGPANLVDATNETTRQINSLTNKVAASNIISGGLVAASVMDLIRATNNDAMSTNEVTRQINSSTNIYASLGTAISDLSLGTNVTIRYNTNAIPTSGALTFGQAYFTNLQASVVLPAFTLANAFYETLVIVVTNSAAATTTLTMPSGVKVALANGGSNLIYCTNGTRTTVVVEHYGNWITNAWKNDF